MQLDSLWIYLIAPILGSLTAVVVCRCLQPGPGNTEPEA
jgi:glycerol uptake facilitator-like aquaporin